MLRSGIWRVVALATFLSQAVTAVNCNANITVSDMSELEVVRNECEVIGGDLTLNVNLTGLVNLDGVRRVTGDLNLIWCSGMGDVECPVESATEVTVSSSSLEEVGGSLKIGSSPGIEKILLPRLVKVGNWVKGFSSHLTELDISNLKQVRRLYLRWVEKLETLNITNLASMDMITIEGASELRRIISNGIQNLTRGSKEEDEEDGTTDWAKANYIAIRDCPKLREVGDLYAGSLARSSDKELRILVDWGENGMSHLEEISLGWTNTSLLDIRGVHDRVRLGNNDTESIYIERGLARVGTDFDRAENLKNVSFGSLYLEAVGGIYLDDGEEQHEDQGMIQLPFDRVRELEVFMTNEVVVEKMSLPERVQNWGLKNLTLKMPRTKFVTRAEDDDDKIIWHWPEDMQIVELEGKIEQDLLDLFIEGDRRVSGEFSVTSTNDGIDCEKVREEMESRVGGGFHCTSHHAWYNDEDAAGVLSIHALHVVGISMAVGMLLWS